MKELVLSTLPKTWILDLDGTLVKHNGYKIDGHDTLLPGVKKCLSQIGENDKVIILTSRAEQYREKTIGFLDKEEIRYDIILFNMPMGERIVVNDRKASGLEMAIAVNVDRDIFRIPEIKCEK